MRLGDRQLIDLAHWQSKGQHICIYIISVKAIREYDPIHKGEPGDKKHKF